MSRREKRRRSRAPMPAAGAGLLRFFEEETRGLRMRPELVVFLATGLILACVLAHIFLG